MWETSNPNIKKWLDMRLDNGNSNYNEMLYTYIITSEGTNKIKEDFINNSILKKEHLSGDVYLHNSDEGYIPHCIGLSLIDLLTNGYDNTVRAPKHLGSAMSQMSSNLYKNSLFFSGALSYSHVDALLAPFIYERNIKYKEAKQAIQNFLHCLDASCYRRGQSLFVNISIDINVPNYLKDIQTSYSSMPLSEYQEEMDIFNKALLDLMIEGKNDGTPFTFPLLTINYTDDIKNRRCDDEVLSKIYELTSKYGAPYFRNMTGELKEKEEYVHSMCCHLRVDVIEKYKDFKRGMWDIGSTLLDYVGGLNVITINLNRIGIEARDDTEYFERLEYLLDKAAQALVYNKKVCQYLLDTGRYDISCRDFENMFNIIGLAGGNESMVNFIGSAMQSKESQRYAIKIMNLVNEKIDEYKRKYGCLFGVEFPPLEKASNRLALKDARKHKDAYVQNKDRNPYITTGFNFHVGSYICDIEWRSTIDRMASSGTVYHIFDGEYRPPDEMQKYIENFARYNIPYFTYSPVMSICPSHGVTYGIKYKCECGMDNYVTAKIVGYCRNIGLWSQAKIDELHERQSRFYRRQIC